MVVLDFLDCVKAGETWDEVLEGREDLFLQIVRDCGSAAQ